MVFFFNNLTPHPPPSPFPPSRYSHSASIVGGKFLVIIGGYDGGVNKSDLFVYNTETGGWIEPGLAGGLPPCHGHAAAYVERTQVYRIYLLVSVIFF